MSSCSISKSATKEKRSTDQQNDVTTNTTSETQNNVKTNTNKSIFDFGSVDISKYKINFEPMDASAEMQIIKPNGDTIKTKNAKLGYERENTKTNNNKTENTTTTVEDYSKIMFQQQIADLTKKIEQLTAKQSEKTEEASSSIILYVMLGFMVIVCFGFFLMYRSVNKYAATVQGFSDSANKILERI